MLSHSWGGFDGETPRLTERLGNGGCFLLGKLGKCMFLYLQYRVCGIFESIERWEGKASIGSSISTGRQTRIEHRRRRRTRSNETKEEEEHLAPMLEGVTQIIGQSRERENEKDMRNERRSRKRREKQ